MQIGSLTTEFKHTTREAGPPLSALTYVFLRNITTELVFMHSRLVIIFQRHEIQWSVLHEIGRVRRGDYGFSSSLFLINLV
jgi:hypothetical protein